NPIATVGRLELHGHVAWIVGEVAPPSLDCGSGEELVAHLDRVDRVVVVCARPAHRDLPAGGDQIAPHDGAIGRVAGPTAGPIDPDEDGLGAAGMTAGGQDADA